MRDIKTWEERIRPSAIQNFTKRLQRDLQDIPWEDLPPVRSYFIHGPVGSGKTFLAANLALERVKENFLAGDNKFIYFITVPEWLNEIKTCYSDSNRNEQDVVDKYSRANLLVLDDFGPERSTDWAMDMLYLLINRRYEDELTTIFTSNLTLQELAAKLMDERIPGRIERMCEIIELDIKHKII